jgi:hypothetical protein
MADKKSAEAASTLLTSFQEANRIVIEHLMAAQEHNRRLAEEFFKNGMEVLRANQQAVTESVVAQERSIQYTQRFFKDGMEMLKANQAAAQSLAAAQEQTMQYIERFFNEGIELLKGQEESMRALLHDLEQQISRQREALQTLASAPMEIALDMFSAPLAAYQSALDVAGAVTREELKWAQKAMGQKNKAGAGESKKQKER